MILGKIRIESFLKKTKGEVYGSLVSDAKDRYYKSTYKWKICDKNPNMLIVSRADGNGSEVKIPKEIPLDESLVSFFGFYSGDGAKGSEDKNNLGRIKPSLSVSQVQPNLVKFSTDNFRRLFPGSIHFVYSLGEDSAYFMAGEGNDRLKDYYGGEIPETPPFSSVCSDPNRYDTKYVTENRDSQDDARRDLAFYHFHKEAMKDILTKQKKDELASVNIKFGKGDRTTASLRRPYKKGARESGGSSRSDEVFLGGVNGIGELFLKIMHEIESSIYDDKEDSDQGLIKWKNTPSKVGKQINNWHFFINNPYARLGDDRPQLEPYFSGFFKGKWPYSSWLPIRNTLTVDPLWCYTSGLYLAEGSTSKHTFFSMYHERPKGLSLSFTSSEGYSLELLLRALKKLFRGEDCLHTWKLKVGSQYFPELVVIGLKNGVPLLRGGETGQGKLRTMEISLELLDWALEIAPALSEYKEKYTHVEPTGAGVPRVDFTASSTLTRWYFPLVMYSVFGSLHANPKAQFKP